MSVRRVVVCDLGCVGSGPVRLHFPEQDGDDVGRHRDEDDADPALVPFYRIRNYTNGFCIVGYDI